MSDSAEPSEEDVESTVLSARRATSAEQLDERTELSARLRQADATADDEHTVVASRRRAGQLDSGSVPTLQGDESDDTVYLPKRNFTKPVRIITAGAASGAAEAVDATVISSRRSGAAAGRFEGYRATPAADARRDFTELAASAQAADPDATPPGGWRSRPSDAGGLGADEDDTAVVAWRRTQSGLVDDGPALRRASTPDPTAMRASYSPRQVAAEPVRRATIAPRAPQDVVDTAGAAESARRTARRRFVVAVAAACIGLGVLAAAVALLVASF